MRERCREERGRVRDSILERVREGGGGKMNFCGLTCREPGLVALGNEGGRGRERQRERETKGEREGGRGREGRKINRAYTLRDTLLHLLRVCGLL